MARREMVVPGLVSPFRMPIRIVVFGPNLCLLLERMLHIVLLGPRLLFDVVASSYSTCTGFRCFTSCTWGIILCIATTDRDLGVYRS